MNFAVTSTSWHENLSPRSEEIFHKVWATFRMFATNLSFQKCLQCDLEGLSLSTRKRKHDHRSFWGKNEYFSQYFFSQKQSCKARPNRKRSKQCAQATAFSHVEALPASSCLFAFIFLPRSFGEALSRGRIEVSRKFCEKCTCGPNSTQRRLKTFKYSFQH